MYLKQYHPTAFYAAQLTKVGDGKEDLYDRGKLMQDAIRHGISISPPDVERSAVSWAADLDAKQVIAGFIQVPGIGPKTAENILSWQKDERDYREMSAGGINAPWSWNDLIKVKGIGPKTIEKIDEFSQADDPFGIWAVERKISPVRDAIVNGENDMGVLPTPTHHSSEMPKDGRHTIVWIGIPKSINYKDYIEATRTRTGKDVEEIIAEMKDPHLIQSAVLICYDEGDENVYLRVNRWRFPEFKAGLEMIKTDQDLVLVKGKKYSGDFGISIHVQDLWIISGD
jgi:DNA polymerase-3 subunit alpha